MGYDRYCAGYLVQEMKEAGFHMDDVYQGTNLTPVLHTFEGDLKDGAYCLGENNLLRAHLLNVAVDININDSRMKPVKLEKRAHIDGAVSIFDALAVKMKFHKEIGRQLTNGSVKRGFRPSFCCLKVGQNFTIFFCTIEAWKFNRTYRAKNRG